MKAGDRIKLTAKAALAASKGFSGLYRVIRVDWAARRGTIKSKNHSTALIKWDDRASLDSWPTAALEKA